jgi:hypothetical protein
LIPGFDGALFSREWKDALWDRFFTAAPQRQRQSVEHKKATRSVAADFLRNLIKAFPFKVNTVLTDNGTHFTDPSGESWAVAEYQSHDRAKGTILGSCLRRSLCPIIA